MNQPHTNGPLSREQKWLHGARNDRWFDIWTVVHVLTGCALGWVMTPYWALVLLIVWEPLEILVLGPLMMRLFGIEFGYESWKNSMSDVFADALGVGLGAFVLRGIVAPPFALLT